MSNRFLLGFSLLELLCAVTNTPELVPSAQEYSTPPWWWGNLQEGMVTK